jgi:DNA polymerase-3 subunit alpha
MPAVAITDHGVLYGVIDFYREAKKQGIKPIIGCEVYVAPAAVWTRKSALMTTSIISFCCVKMKPVTRIWLKWSAAPSLRDFITNPVSTGNCWNSDHEGLIALSACVAGEIPQMVLNGQGEAARETALWYQQIFGAGNFYLEIQDHGMEAEKTVCRELARISQSTGIPLVATNDLHYLKREDASIHDVLLCIQTGKTVQDEERMRFPGNEFYMKSEVEMRSLFADFPQALDNSLHIAEACNLEFHFGEFHLPYFDIPAGYDPETYLEQLAWEKFAQRYPQPTEKIIERFNYELQMIKQMGFAEYFLIVQDLVNWARHNQVPVGPGRGSAAGSLVSYALGITNIDPLKYDLLFERFLNPERVSMPDIDIDFCFEKRDQVINYIVERYGADRVAQIITFGTMAARAAIRDVGRALNVPYGEVDKIAKLIPAELGVTLDRSLEIAPDLLELYQNNYDARKIIDLARAIEGMPRHASILRRGGDWQRRIKLHRSAAKDCRWTCYHAICQGDGGRYWPAQDGYIGAQNLDRDRPGLGDYQKTRNLDISIDELPLDAPEVYKLLKDKNTIGVFQLEVTDCAESWGNAAQPVRRSDCHHCSLSSRALGSGMVEDFINCKHGRQKIEYIDPRLQDILQETYGVVLYQEQVMRIASDLAGFSMGEADVLRRAMGKKKVKELMDQRDKFVDGAARNHISAENATRLFDIMESFAGYGFNKSHSAAYALITYQTAYLKAYFPEEYMCAFLSSVIDHQDRVVFYIKECKKMGIDILPPDINESF